MQNMQAPHLDHPDRIDLWFTFLEDVAGGPENNDLLQRYRALLSPPELQAQQRFHFEKDRHRYLVTRALVRTVLSRYAPIAPQDWEFAANAYGKPSVAKSMAHSAALAQTLSFNVSHTQDLVVLGVTHGAALGVDVESTQRGAALDAAQAFFAPSEVADLAQLPAHLQADRFFQYWTLKESYIKARGLGLSIGLDQFSFDLSQPGRVRLWVAAHWRFWQLRPSPQHWVAVCARSQGQSHNSAQPTLHMRRVVPLGADQDIDMACERVL
jgi:4'-phosphopantetheinyl transferase